MTLLFPIMCFGQEIENDINVKTYAVPDSVSKNASKFSVSDSLSVANGHSANLVIENPLQDFEILSPLDPLSSAKDIVQPGTAVISLWKMHNSLPQETYGIGPD